MRQKTLAILTVVIGGLALAGCGNQIPPLNFSVPNMGLSEHPLDAEVRSITVTLARPDEQVGQLDYQLAETAGAGLSSGIALTSVWQTSLQEAFDRTLIFRDDGSKKVSVAVKVLKLDVPGAGISFKTDTVARYEVIDRSNGDIIFSQDVASSGETPGNYAYLGIARARESINRAVQNNIALFLQAAETIDLTKPMFPAGV